MIRVRCMSTPKAQQNHGESLLSGYTSLAKIGMESLSFILPSTTSIDLQHYGLFHGGAGCCCCSCCLLASCSGIDVVELTMMSERTMDFGWYICGSCSCCLDAGSIVEVVDEHWRAIDAGDDDEA